jgi:hypothetical protein
MRSKTLLLSSVGIPAVPLTKSATKTVHCETDWGDRQVCLAYRINCNIVHCRKYGMV